MDLHLVCRDEPDSEAPIAIFQDLDEAATYSSAFAAAGLGKAQIKTFQLDSEIGARPLYEAVLAPSGDSFISTVEIAGLFNDIPVGSVVPLDDGKSAYIAYSYDPVDAINQAKAKLRQVSP